MQRISEYTQMDSSFKIHQEHVKVQFNLVPRAFSTVQNGDCHIKILEKALETRLTPVWKNSWKTKFLRSMLNVFLSGLAT